MVHNTPLNSFDNLPLILHSTDNHHHSDVHRKDAKPTASEGNIGASLSCEVPTDPGQSTPWT